ncbi:MAG: hypothetical protein ACXWDO_01700 [Bacteroidia bacterium]
MNYLSHYFLDVQAGKPYHNFGLVLPDMLGVALRGWKPDFNKIIFEQDSHLNLVEGIRKHHIADAFFHSSLFFTSNAHTIRKILEANNFSQAGTRLFFVAHIFLEFMLDRIIMQQHTDIAKHFYIDIDMVKDELLLPFFINTQTEAGSFFNFLNSFRKHQYLYAYLEPESFFYALNRTLQRAKQQPFPETLMQDFINVIYETELLLKPVYESFFAEMRKV